MAQQGFVRVGDIAPDFQADTTQGPIKFHEWIGNSWAILFSHPADFTPVCTTELGEAARLHEEFTKRNTKIIALSVDSVESHNKWQSDIDETQKVTVKYPIIADADRKVSVAYGMLDNENPAPGSGLPLTVRSVFVIDPAKKVRLTFTYPASCGRNFTEILRVVDSLQTTDAKKVVTPVNWKKGDDVIIPPTINNETAKEQFGEFTTLKPYLRIVKGAQVN